jgi:hypothetical protein
VNDSVFTGRGGRVGVWKVGDVEVSVDRVFGEGAREQNGSYIAAPVCIDEVKIVPILQVVGMEIGGGVLDRKGGLQFSRMI